MKNTDLQLHLIEILDNVVARIEELVTSSEALNQINIDILKNDIRSLYKDVCEIERTELRNPVDSVHKMKNSVNELKRKLELFSLENDTSATAGTFSPKVRTEKPLAPTAPEEQPDFRPVLESESPKIPLSAEPEEKEDSERRIQETPLPLRNESEPLSSEENPDAEPANPGPEETETSGPVSDEDEFPQRIPEPEETTTLRSEQASGNGTSDPRTDPFPEKETVSFPTELPITEEPEETAFPPVSETEAQDFSEQILSGETPGTEAPTEEFLPDLSEFIASREEEPSSYVTELTAMVQAQVGEQDMSKVAVSSTAMPDERIVNQVANRSGIFNKLKETQKLSSTDPQNALKSLVEKMKSNRTVNDVHQGSAESMKALIGLNEKFLFLNQLFRGNVKEYNDMLQEIDQQPDRGKAMEVLNAYRELYSWNPETLPFLTLQDLTKKRFPEE